MNIDFFILPNQDDERLCQFIGAQVKSYYEAGKTVVIYAEDELCQRLDSLLWFDAEDDFLPHFYNCEFLAHSIFYIILKHISSRMTPNY